MQRGSIIVKTRLAPGARVDGLLNPTHGYVWPSDHYDVSADLSLVFGREVKSPGRAGALAIVFSRSVMLL